MLSVMSVPDCRLLLMHGWPETKTQSFNEPAPDLTPITGQGMSQVVK
jgi:hypothetical protein